MANTPKMKDGSTTVSGGKIDYEAEVDGGKWQVERDNTKALREQMKKGDAAAAKVQKGIDKEDPDFQPPSS